MLDLKELRKDFKGYEIRLKTKDPEIELSALEKLDIRIREKQTECEGLKAERNSSSKEIGEKKQRKEAISESLSSRLHEIKIKIESLEKELVLLENERDSYLSILPNLPDKDIPVSLNPKDNVCIKEHGSKTNFSFSPKNHVELNETLKIFDLEKSAKTTGSGWPLYTGIGARLEWALINYMLDIHIKRGFIPIMPPLLVRPEIMFGSGQLPKFEKQLFRLNDEEYHLFLIPTAEVVLNGLHTGEIIPKEKLPIKYVSYTPCFRREAGAAGQNERGLIRMHQFNKVELFAYCAPEKSLDLFEEILLGAEEVLKGLELHFRNMLLVTGDMSFAASKTVDVEVWLPGQNRYYEVSSVSNCSDFQARRSMTRCRQKNDKPEFIHTLNGSGVATSRLMVAILENNQQADGSVIIPKVLWPYLGAQKLVPVD